MQRLDKFLVNLGYGSRTEIKLYAKQGRITVNNIPINKTDIKINEHTDVITFDGTIVTYKEHIYIMLNKKAGFVTANYDQCCPTVFDLLSDTYKNIDLFAVGRLDKDTEGFLLLTNDGHLSHNLMSPKKHVDKCYYVEVDYDLRPEHVVAFKDGITLRDGTKFKPATLEILSKNTAYVTISEGKFHQIKNMFRVIDLTVTSLKRVKIADLSLDPTLPIGSFRELTLQEEQYLKEITGGL